MRNGLRARKGLIMKFKGWIIAGPSHVELKEFDTEVGGGLVSTDSPDFETAPRTPLRDDQVILRNIKSAICGSDKWLYPLGGDIRRPRGCQFGHEMVSEIIAMGKDVKGFELGDRVYPFPIYVKESTAFAGRPGAFSELVVCDYAEVNKNLYHLDERITDTSAAMIEPFTVGFRSAVTTRAKPGERAVVLGAGPIGLAAAICLREMGVEDITVVNRSRGRLEIAKALDKEQPFHTVSTLDEGWLEGLEERFGTTRTQTGPALDVDVWIDAASNAELLQTVYNKCKLFARISVVGVHHKPVEFDLRKLTWSGVELLGSAGYRPEDVPNVMKAMESGRYDIDSLVTATYPFQKFDEAIEFCQDGSKCLKCELDFSESEYANWRDTL